MADTVDTGKSFSWVVAVIAAMATALAAGSQPQAAGERPEFEAASLKPAPSGATGFSILPVPGGRLRASNITLNRLVAVAYSVKICRFTVWCQERNAGRTWTGEDA